MVERRTPNAYKYRAIVVLLGGKGRVCAGRSRAVRLLCLSSLQELTEFIVPRPTKYSPQTGHRIAEHVRYGATIDEAARSEGTTHDSVERWMRRYPEFCAEITRAQADMTTQNLRHMNIAATRGSWQAAAWLLEHLVPERFSKSAAELPVLLNILLQKLPPETAGQVLAAWGLVGLGEGSGSSGSSGDVTPARAAQAPPEPPDDADPGP